jgi:hypothetical protein
VVEAYTAPWRAIAAHIRNKRDLSAKPGRIPLYGMVKRSFFRLQVFVSTMPASVTTQRGVTPSAGILAIVKATMAMVMACFAVNVQTNDRARDPD